MAEIVADQDRLRIVAACFVYDRDLRFLIIRRSPGRQPYPGLWTVPAGGLEPEDYLEHTQTADGWESVLERTVRREVREEAGIEIGEPQFLNNFVFIRSHDGVPV